MKNAFFFFFILSSANLFAQDLLENKNKSAILQIYDSIYTWKLDTSNLAWKFDTRNREIVYDGELNMQSYTQQYFYGNTWINSAHYINSWDMNHYLISQTRLSWNGITWENDFKVVFTYDDQYRRTDLLYQNWTNEEWENYQIFSTTYDEFGNQTKYLHQDWENGNWVNHYQNLYLYDTEQYITKDTRQDWADTAWVNYFQTIYEYDVNGNQTIESHQDWENDGWIYIYRLVNTYNDNNQEIQILNQNRSNGNWTDASRSYLTYDGNDDLVNVLTQAYFSGSGWHDAWNADYFYDAFHNEIRFFSHLRYNNSWVSENLKYNTYDENNFKISNSNRYWSQDGTQITRGDSIFNYFYTVVGIEDPEENYQSASIFPNPASEEIYIDLTDFKSSSDFILEILNLNGQIVEKVKISGSSNSLDVSKLPPGLYIIRLSSNIYHSSSIFIKL